MPLVTRVPELTPSDVLRTPTLFRLWLARGARRFEQPSYPTSCPLAQFLVASCDLERATVSPHRVLCTTHEGRTYSVMLPRWARRFLLLWDLYAFISPARPGTRVARLLSRLVRSRGH